MSTHHHSGGTYPEGRVLGPGVLYGAIALVLAGAMQAVGLFHKGDAALREFLSGALFSGAEPDAVATPLLLIIAAAFSFGLAFAVLDSAGGWRRLVLGITAIIVILAMVPTFAVWRMYFSPFMPAVALFWAWFCTMMYANHHVMPCDGQAVAAVSQVNIVTRPEPGRELVETQVSTPEAAEEHTDPDAKYKPREDDNNEEQNLNGQG